MDDTATQDTKISRKSHDWIALKSDFMMGEYPSVAEFLRKKGISMSNSVQTTGWMKEKEEFRRNALATATQKAMEVDSESVVESRQRQARIARFIQLKGIAKMNDLEPSNIDDARKLVVSGLEQERRALGLEGGGTQNLTQININPKTNIDKMLEKLDYAGILELVADLRRERSRRTGTEDITISAEEVRTDGTE